MSGNQGSEPVGLTREVVPIISVSKRVVYDGGRTNPETIDSARTLGSPSVVTPEGTPISPVNTQGTVGEVSRGSGRHVGRPGHSISPGRLSGPRRVPQDHVCRSSWRRGETCLEVSPGRFFCIDHTVITVREIKGSKGLKTTFRISSRPLGRS